jgi:hypothetical protein
MNNAETRGWDRIGRGPNRSLRRGRRSRGGVGLEGRSLGHDPHVVVARNRDRSIGRDDKPGLRLLGRSSLAVAAVDDRHRNHRKERAKAKDRKSTFHNRWTPHQAVSV